MRQLKITKQVTNRETASLDKYLQEIGKVDLISADEEVELAKKIKDVILKFNLNFLKYTRPFLPPFFRLIPPARWARQRLTKNPNLRFTDKAKI